MPILLQEAARYLFYTPFYAALSLRLYEKEGLDVRFVPSAGSAYAANSVLDGMVDVAWGGPSRLLANYDKDHTSELVAFCEVVTRDPFFLVGRRPLPNMTFRDLLGLRVGIVSEVPTPWHCLQEDLRQAGIDPRSLSCKIEGTMSENIVILRSGELDVIQLFEPHVSEVVNAEEGFVWYASAARGPTSYTTLYTRRGFIAQRRDEMKGMVRAIHRVQKWIAASPAEDIAETIAEYFPDLPKALTTSTIRRHKETGIWGLDPRLPRSGFDRLKASFLSGGFIKTGLTFDRAVDNSLAEEVIREA